MNYSLIKERPPKKLGFQELTHTHIHTYIYIYTHIALTEVTVPPAISQLELSRHPLVNFNEGTIAPPLLALDHTGCGWDLLLVLFFIAQVPSKLCDELGICAGDGLKHLCTNPQLVGNYASGKGGNCLAKCLLNTGRNFK